jgi:hypothetical protein
MSEQPLTPAETAQNEAARQAVVLAFSVAGILLYVAAQRAAGDPDFYRGLRMRASKKVERGMALLARWAWHEAERAREAYEQDSA